MDGIPGLYHKYGLDLRDSFKLLPKVLWHGPLMMCKHGGYQARYYPRYQR